MFSNGPVKVQSKKAVLTRQLFYVIMFVFLFLLFTLQSSHINYKPVPDIAF